MVTASASFSGLLCYSLPYCRLVKHLTPLGAAIAGWTGTVSTRRVYAMVLTDADLFSPGTISLNGIKIFGDFSVQKVISYTASVIRASGSNLEKCFYELLRSQGYSYHHVDNLLYKEEGGMEALIRKEHVLVGSAPFMEHMGVALPRGLRVRGAVFVALDGELAGIFALSYTPSEGTRTALHALSRSRLHSVLATRNFSITPDMLSRCFRISSRKMDYPPVQRRRELAETDGGHGDTILAVLCRAGLAPYAAAVLGACRLRTATLVSAILAVFGAVIGLLLAFYMAFSGAFFSLTPANLLVFLLLWLVPTLLISAG